MHKKHWQLRKILFLLAGLVLMSVAKESMAVDRVVPGAYSVEERLSQYGAGVEQRLRPAVEAAGLAYPPGELAYVAFKDSLQMEIYGRMGPGDGWRFIRRYPILRSSGKPGPKLAEGDYQVPEGIYRAEFLNANSRFHLSIRLDYPNGFDRSMARIDGRKRLGGDIMIHGSTVSVGYLAMGDAVAEELFILAALVKKENVRIVVSPTDFRLPGSHQPVVDISWVKKLYDLIRVELGAFPVPGKVD